jgi:hypothetical protein
VPLTQCAAVKRYPSALSTTAEPRLLEEVTRHELPLRMMSSLCVLQNER